MKHITRSLMVVWLGAVILPAHAGPIGVYYLTDSANNTIDAIQGNGIRVNPSAFPSGAGPRPGREGPLALLLPNLIRTANIGGGGGAEYGTGPGLSVSPLRLLNAAAFDMTDGTTDGQYNYAMSYRGGVVYRFDTHWANGATLFTLPTSAFGEYEGITYDSYNKSLWVSTVFGWVGDYDLNGGLLTSFTTGADQLGVLQYALALDLNRTLWLADATSPTSNGVIRNYDIFGNFLGSDTYSGIGQAFGGEIVPYPETAIAEPATLGLLAPGVLGFLAGRRRVPRAVRCVR
jgi:hypothetical protein